LGFTKLGYKPVAVSEAMTTGQFVHEGLRAYFAGGALDIEDAEQAMAKAKANIIQQLAQLEDRQRGLKLVSETDYAITRAYQLFNRYFNAYAGDYQDPMPEVELNHAKVICHVDLVAKFREELAVIDFKTSKSPDLRWYALSGQCDVYSYVLMEQKNPVGLIIYDIISEEGLFRYTRRPNLDRGKRLFQQIDTLDNYEVSFLLGKPQCQWDCPRCDWFHPCWLMETDEPKGAIEYLMDSGEYIKDEKEN